MAHEKQIASLDPSSSGDIDPIHELVVHLKGDGGLVRQEWIRRIADARVLSAMTGDGVLDELMLMYDSHVKVLGSGSMEALADHGRQVRERLSPRGVGVGEVMSLVLLLREVIVRSLVDTWGDDRVPLRAVLMAYERMANRIALGAVIACLQDREDAVALQREAVRELAAPIMQVRDRLLMLPVVGPLDILRVDRITTELLRAIRLRRARVVVVDVAGVPAIDAVVAAQLVQAVDAARLLGATVILTGLSSAVAQSLVAHGVMLDNVCTMGDLQGGLEEAEHLLGYRVVPVEEPAGAEQDKG